MVAGEPGELKGSRRVREGGVGKGPTWVPRRHPTSDRHRAPGHLSRQGPPALRWALYEAAQHARFPNSPDREYYLKAAEKLGGNRACLALARKLLRRCYHTLRELGDDALAPPTDPRPSAAPRRDPPTTDRPVTRKPTDALAA
jgi:hypothetical protein